MQRNSTDYQERVLDLGDPDKTLIIEQKGLEIADILYEPTKLNPRAHFFNKASSGDPEGSHQLISCNKNLVSVYSISVSEGIQLNSRFPLKTFSEEDTERDLRSLKRTFVNNPDTKKLTITTRAKKEMFVYDVNFEQIDTIMEPKHAHKNPKSRPLILGGSYPGPTLKYCHLSQNSYRRFDQNCIIEIRNGTEFADTYISPITKHPVPIILSKVEYPGLEKVFKDQISRLSKPNLKYFKSLMESHDWDLGYGWRWFMENRVKFSCKNVNNRLYALEFNMSQFLTVLKIRANFSRKSLKTVSFIPAEILAAGLRAKRLRKDCVKTAKLTGYDPCADKLTIEGEVYVYDERGNIEDSVVFKLTASNCLLKRKKKRYSMQLAVSKVQEARKNKVKPEKPRWGGKKPKSGVKKTRAGAKKPKPGAKKEKGEVKNLNVEVRKGCFGCFDYFLTRENGKTGALVLNYFKTGGSKDKTENLILSIKKPLLDRLTKIEEVGVMEAQKLVYFRDKRFMYLIEILSGEVRQRLRYTAFETLVKTSQSPNLCFNIFGKFDKESGILELFRVNKGSIEDLVDLKLRALIGERIKKDQMRFNAFQNIKIAESSKKGELSIRVRFYVRSSKTVDVNDREHIFLIHLDKKSLKINCKYLIPVRPLYSCPGRPYSLSYDEAKEDWNYLVQSSENWSYRGLHNYRFGKPHKDKPVDRKIDMKGDLSDLESSREILRSFLFGTRIFMGSRHKDRGIMNDYQLSVFEKAPRGAETPYNLIRSIAVDRENYSFLDENRDLKVFIFRSTTRESLPKVLLTDKDLVVSHKLAIRGMCGILEQKRVRVRTLPRSLNGGKKLLLKVKNYEEYDDHAEYIFFLDLSDCRLARVRRVSGQSSGAAGNLDLIDMFSVNLWGPGLVLLDSLIYSFGQ